MSRRPDPGPVEWKPARGLGGWRRGELVRWDGERVAIVRAGGREHEVPARYVRPQAAPKPRPSVRIVDRDASPQKPASGHRDVKPDNLSPKLGAARRRIPWRAVPKPRRPLRDEGFLDFVRARPCCVCASPPPSHPHHFGPRGMGQKTDDLRVVALCPEHHEEWHRKLALPSAGLDTEQCRVRFLAVQVDQLVEWIGAGAEVL